MAQENQRYDPGLAFCNVGRANDNPRTAESSAASERNEKTEELL
jgi:hypothetical protein